jgi:hypothetical protein
MTMDKDAREDQARLQSARIVCPKCGTTTEIAVFYDPPPPWPIWGVAADPLFCGSCIAENIKRDAGMAT